MASTPGYIPDLQSLQHGLTLILNRHGLADDSVTVVSRQPNVHASTFPSEIVTCRLPDGEVLRLLCKYGAGRSHRAHGHRGDLAYEADVYQHVMQPLQIHAVRFYGAHVDGVTDHTWLALEYLEESMRFAKVPSSGRHPITGAPHTMLQAARWIGHFHSVNEARISSPSLQFLKVYDSDYYLSWAHRTLEFSSHLRERFPWLEQLCMRYEEAVAALLAVPPTIIHGEYYPKNVLFLDGRIYPVDWESTALAAGEVDLASLTERWDAEAVRQCEVEYQRERWPHGAPPGFQQRLAAARLYWQFRWLGERMDWTVRDSQLLRFEQLRVLGRALGLV